MLKLAETQFKLIHDIFDRLDQKILDTLKTNLTFMTINFGIGYFLIDKFPSPLAAIFYLGSVLFFAWSIIISTLNRKPLDVNYLNPSKFYNRHYNESLPDLLETASVTIGSTINTLEEQSESKARLLTEMINNQIRAISLMAISFIILILDFFL